MASVVVEERPRNEILQNRFKEYSGMNSIEADFDKNNSRLENNYMKLIVSRTMFIFFLCVVSTPFLMESFYTSKYDMLNSTFETLILQLA